jgi:hypothetical protein
MNSNKIQWKHIYFEWLGNWRWILEAKLLEQSYRRLHTQFQSCLRGTISTMDDSECFGFNDLREILRPTGVWFINFKIESFDSAQRHFDYPFSLLGGLYLYPNGIFDRNFDIFKY